jgi:hypothetical protein
MLRSVFGYMVLVSNKYELFNIGAYCDICSMLAQYSVCELVFARTSF